MDRRTFLAALPAAMAAPTPRPPMGLVIHSFGARQRKPLPPAFTPVADPLDFIAHAAALGAAGVQTRLVGDPARLRAAAETHGLYLEGSVGLPTTDAEVDRFATELRTARAAGADVVRTVCLSGRRYETFDSAERFRRFAADARKAVERAEPVARRERVTLAVENHKDWRTDELVALVRGVSSERVRVCVDTGNSVALLEDPAATVAALAPFAATTHLKDMGVREADDGFLLSEVPFGDGFLDLPKLVGVLRAANPRVRLNLEMITRDPLRVPCLTERYWATLPDVPARELAAALARVRRHRSPKPLPTVAGLDHPAVLAAELANVERCLRYAAEKL
jgi:sugar phosphate isomerase/epimerase